MVAQILKAAERGYDAVQSAARELGLTPNKV